NSENQNEYYYGVSRKESARRGLRGYNPNDRWSPYLDLCPSYHFLGHCTAYGTPCHTPRAEYLTDIPMLSKSCALLASHGVLQPIISYLFCRGFFL
ncbi:MipA/OmpV family protein, partial [Escherichia coli]|uniref:MipA/OmpV family protein n=1 Tax=Escherichia coli TaxID=562 RepID=UPI0010CAD420